VINLLHINPQEQCMLRCGTPVGAVMKGRSFQPPTLASALSLHQRFAQATGLVWLLERQVQLPCQQLIQDRYQSKALHRTISLIMSVPMVFYLTAQFAALGNTIASLSQGAVPAVVGQIILAIVMLLYETLGGLKGVAITDVLQGILLLVGTLATCGVLSAIYGPFDAAYLRIITNTRYARVSIRTLIHIYSHTYTWRCLRVYEHTHYHFLPIVCYFAQVPGMFLGIYGTNPNFLATEVAAGGYFGSAMDELLRGDIGTIFTGGIVLLGSLAAIMSTADSAIISCSNVVTIDLIKGWLWPMCKGGVEPNGKQTMLVSKIASLIIVIFGVLLCNLNLNLSALFVLQGALLCQATPAYILGLYHPTILDQSILAGMVVGTIVLIVRAREHTHAHAHILHTYACARTHTYTHTGA
jgi:SSS family solute:Na+ symporter/sodium/pantothenate symporter